MDEPRSGEEWDARAAREREAYEADPIARAVGAVILERVGRSPVRAIIGTFGCLQVAEAVREME